jgi:cyclic pyranopterin phosphate synthase
MLADNFGRRFYYLRLSITDVCNFRCNYCLPDGYACDHERDFLRLDEISRLAKGFADMGTEKIRITGGEPSLRKDLPEIINAVKQTQGIKTVALTSNGFKLPEHLPSWLDAGLDALNISIDSLDPRQFHAITGHNKLDTVLKGIDQGLSAGFTNIKVNTVLMRQYSGHEMQSFLDWVKDTPITLRFIELMQTGDNKAFFDQQHLKGQSIKEQLLNSGWQSVIKEKSAGPAQEFWHPDYAGKIGLIMPYSKDFCNSCNRLRVSSLGKLHLCLFADHGLNLRDYLQTDDVAPLQEQIKHLLGDKKATHFLKEGFTGATKHLAMLGG